MKIAFATKDGTLVDEHFGRASVFAIYDFESGKGIFEKLVPVSPPDESSELSAETGKIDNIIETLSGCAIVYCAEIGPHAAARVVRSKIHPIKVPEPVSMETEVERVNRLLENPPIWIRKIMAGVKKEPGELQAV